MAIYRWLLLHKQKWLATVALLVLLLPAEPPGYRVMMGVGVALGLVALYVPRIRLDWLSAQPANAPRALWPLIGALLVTGTLCFLEWRQPLYFVQDDNHSQFFPILLDAMRHAFNEWRLPTWNARQGMGYPTIDLGGYTLTYPPTYLSYVLAVALGNPFYMIEIFAWLHILGGYALMYAVLRQAGVRPVLAMAASTCFAINGYHLLYGRSWYIILPVAVYFPAMIGSLLALQRGIIGVRWILWTGMIFGVWYHSGHVQLWVYGLTLWGLGACWCIVQHRSMRIRMAAACSAAVLLALAVAMPLLYLQQQMYAGFKRPNWGGGIQDLIAYLLIPSPNSQLVGFFCNTVLLGGCLIALVLGLAAFGKRKGASFPPVLLPVSLFIVALLWAWGDRGPFWNLLVLIPPFNQFNGPQKLAVFFIGFAIVAGTWFWELALRRRKYLATLLAFVAIGFSFNNVLLSTASFFSFADKPYPVTLPEEMKPMTEMGYRVAPLAATRGFDKDYTYTLANNYPSLYGVFSVSGYGSIIIENHPNSSADSWSYNRAGEYMREYGVGWIILGNPMYRYYASANPGPRLPPQPFPAGSVKAYHVIPVLEPDTKPLAYYEADGAVHPLSFTVRADGLEIRLPANCAQCEQVTANFFYRKAFKAYTHDGSELPISKDGYDRIVVSVRPPTSTVILRYAPPWGPAFALAAVCAALSFAMAKLSARSWRW